MDNSTQCSTPATSQLCLHSCSAHNQHSYSVPYDHAGIIEEDDRHTLISGSSTITFSEVPTLLCMSGEPTISQEHFDENDRVEMISPAILERSVNSQCFDPSYYMYHVYVYICVYMCIYVYVATYFQHDRYFTIMWKASQNLHQTLQPDAMTVPGKTVDGYIIDRTSKAICLPLNTYSFHNSVKNAAY